MNVQNTGSIPTTATLNNNPYIDYVKNSSPLKTNESRPSPQVRIQLPAFFERLIDDIVHKVAIMVLFHIVHFFCHTFWEDYSQEFDRKEAIENKKQEAADQKKETIDSLKQEKSDLDKKMEKFLQNKTHPKPGILKPAKTID